MTEKHITASRRNGDEWQEVNCHLAVTSLEIQFHLEVTCLVFFHREKLKNKIHLMRFGEAFFLFFIRANLKMFVFASV